MSNSVYADDSNVSSQYEVVNTVKLTDENFRDSATNNKEEPVIIYVERVVARLDLKINLSDGTTIEGAGDNAGKTIYKVGSYAVTGKEGEQDIYVLLHGWNVSTTKRAHRSSTTKRRDR